MLLSLTAGLLAVRTEVKLGLVCWFENPAAPRQEMKNQRHCPKHEMQCV